MTETERVSAAVESIKSEAETEHKLGRTHDETECSSCRMARAFTQSAPMHGVLANLLAEFMINSPMTNPLAAVVSHLDAAVMGYVIGRTVEQGIWLEERTTGAAMGSEDEQ